MKDKEIVKALECCKKDDCDNCPNDFGNCYANLAGYALDLINRLQEDNERLRESRNRWRQIAEDFDRFSREEERMIENDKKRT
jgi:hypothetical protein